MRFGVSFHLNEKARFRKNGVVPYISKKKKEEKTVSF
jgi:hypothetical protein